MKRSFHSSNRALNSSAVTRAVREFSVVVSRLGPLSLGEKRRSRTF